MLNVKIVNSDGSERIYREELIEFSWLTRNNEGASFSASVPSLTATLLITPPEFDAFVNNINRESDIFVYSDDEGGLTLPLSVIESTPLSRKGTLEISCTGNFFTETNSIFGTLKVEADDWEDTQAKFGLGMVELHEPNNEFTANVTKKEDIALAAAWSFNTRRNISCTPFTTGDNNFKNDGIGIFRNMKEQANDVYAPVYRIYSEDIIDYDVEAAQPPVTHIQTTTLGKLAPNPQIPETTVVKYSGKAGSSDISTNVRSFYLEESQLAAIYMLSEQKDAQGQVVMASQNITWSDGVQTTFDSNDQIKVIGIFSTAFVDVLNNTQIRLIDRTNSNNIIATINVNDALELWEDTDQSLLGARRTNKISGTDIYTGMGDAEILWFKKVTTDGVAGLWYDGTNYGLVTVSSTYAGYEFVESCKVNSDTANDTKYYVEALFIKGVQRIAIYFTRAVNTSPQFGVQALPNIPSVVSSLPATLPIPFTITTPTGIVQLVANINKAAFTQTAKGLDYIAKKLTPTSSAKAYALNFVSFVLSKEISDTVTYEGAQYSVTLPVGTASTLQIVEMDYISSSSSATLKFASSEYSNGRWVVDSQAIAPDYLSTSLLLIDPKGTWYLLSDTVEESTSAFLLAQTGSIPEWSSQSQMFYTMCRGAFMAYVYMGDNYWTVYLQMDSVPFLSRQSGVPTMSQRIAEGTTNEVVLAFKVGALQQDDKFIWDKDTGRIEIELSKFRVRDNITREWIEKDVQALNIIATTAYVRVQLDPAEPNDWITIKTTGFSLNYDGLVTAKVSGIIVE